MERFEVPSRKVLGNIHFTRWRVVQTPWVALYVHKFETEDEGTFHDHPWGFLSFVLKGGYVEHYIDPMTGERESREIKRWSFNRKRTHDFHYIARLTTNPTWTILLVGPRRRTWGFLSVDNPIYREWIEHTTFPKWQDAKEAAQ